MKDATIRAGRRIRQFREARGVSRSHLAQLVGVDVTAVSAWEAGKYRPRVDKRLRLAKAFGVTLEDLFADGEYIPLGDSQVLPIDDYDRFTALVLERTSRTDRRIHAIHCSRVRITRPSVMVEFRALVSKRLLAGTMQMDHIEVIYDLSRLKEVVWNIFNYEGCPYRISAYCAVPSIAVPGINAFLFDEQELLVGAHWQGDWNCEPAKRKLRLSLSSGAMLSYFRQYWQDMWDGGIVLNGDGPRDLSNVRAFAIKLGLPASDWPAFLEEARALTLPGGAPPFV